MCEVVRHEEASLYVGDLHPEISEATIFEKFSQVGVVVSVRVCRDAITGRSLRYAYVNYLQPAEAERALDFFNYDSLKGVPMRIMRKQRNPALRKSGKGNIFIKNLDLNIDSRALYETFSSFGNILSCKVVTTENNTSKGYGYVHFEDEASALNAIEKVNGLLLNDKKVFVGKFVSRPHRKLLEKSTEFTNIYVKNFAQKLDENKLKTIFEKFGKIQSLVVSLDESGQSRGFAFVNYEEPEEALQAVKQMNGYQIDDDCTLYVGRAQKKVERLVQLKKDFEMLKESLREKYRDLNIYVKNLPDDFTDDNLREMFSKYGTVHNAKVMTQGGKSRGFGFVCYTTAQEAQVAINDANGKVVGEKCLYVSLAQPAKDRKCLLETQYSARTRLSVEEIKKSAGSSLFFGDLHPDIKEDLLRFKLSELGVGITSFSLQRGKFAKITFQEQSQAEKVMKELNYERIEGWPIRIMWWEGSPFRRFCEVSNIYVDNLEQALDSKDLYDKFSTYGNIYSCKVCTGRDFISKGYGFVCYENEEAAMRAIEEGNGTMMKNCKVYVEKFVRREDRERVLFSNSESNYKNLYVKNFDLSVDENKLREVFQRFGDVKSVSIARDENRSSRGFGFVSFFVHQDAKNAQEALNESILEGTKDILYVSRALRRQERVTATNGTYRVQKQNNCDRFKLCNVYVKNLDDTVNDDKLRKMFSPYGLIRSARVMMHGRVSRGFGFVCFAEPAQAVKAIEKLNNRMLGSKPLYVSLAQSRKERTSFFIRMRSNDVSSRYSVRAISHYPSVVHDSNNYYHQHHHHQPRINVLRSSYSAEYYNSRYNNRQTQPTGNQMMGMEQRMRSTQQHVIPTYHHRTTQVEQTMYSQQQQQQQATTDVSMQQQQQYQTSQYPTMKPQQMMISARYQQQQQDNRTLQQGYQQGNNNYQIPTTNNNVDEKRKGEHGSIPRH